MKILIEIARDLAFVFDLIPRNLLFFQQQIMNRAARSKDKKTKLNYKIAELKNGK